MCLIHCLSPRKGGFDDLHEELQSDAVALTLNLPYNFSQMIFNYMALNITSSSKFLLYPRFIQMIIDDKIPDLPRANTDLMRFSHHNDKSYNRMKKYFQEDIPVVHPLFEHLINPSYVSPLVDRWRGNDSGNDEAEDVTGLEDYQGNTGTAGSINLGVGLFDREIGEGNVGDAGIVGENPADENRCKH